MKSVNLAIVGVGYWGKNLFRAFSFIPEVNILYAVDFKEENLDFAHSLQPTCKQIQNYKEALKDPKVHGVIIATPPKTHHQIAKDSLEAGKHTFVEKPLSLVIDDAQDLVQLSKKKQKILMVGHLLKHHPVSHYLKEMIHKGDLGEINYVYTQRLNLGIIRSDENPLWSLSPHDISLILFFLGGMPTEVFASGGCFLQEKIEDVVFAGLHFPDGKMAHLHLSWLDPHKIRRITIVGTKKMAVFDDMEPREKLRIYDKGAVKKSYDPGDPIEYLNIRDGDIYIPKIEAKEPLRNECQNFVQCIMGKAKSNSDGEEALRILKVITKLDESLKERGKVIRLT